MAVLQQLGLNSSVIIQFAIFVLTLFVLSQVAFGPYLKAQQERELRTKGGEDLASELLKKSDELKATYENKARQVNGEIKTIFDEYRDQANKESGDLVAKARIESQKLVEEARRQVALEISEATAKLKNEVSSVSNAITKKLVAK